MIVETDINSLESKKISLELRLNELLKNNAEQDKINELKSEILYTKKQINKKLGTKEVEVTKKLKRKKSRVDEKNIENYNFIKEGYKKISNINISTNKIIKVIDVYLNKQQYNEDYVKVMSK